jgi:cyclophilin family peptidyl-prolyl cis-trans isomerase
VESCSQNKAPWRAKSKENLKPAEIRTKEMKFVCLFISLFVAVATAVPHISVPVKNCEVVGNIPNPSPAADTKAPAKFTVSFETNVIINGQKAAPIVLEVIRNWAPLGVDRFYSLVKDGFYNQAAFFRVVPNFVLQFGISAVPAENEKWNTIIADDPVVVSNTNWTVSYATAGPDTRTTQLFINYVDNSRLDDSGNLFLMLFIFE